MVAFKLQRLSGGGSANKKNDRLKGDPRLLGILSFPDGNYLVATPQGYDSIKLQFLVPSVFLGYTRLAVVRSNYGFPVNKHDGVTVFEYPNTATPVSQTFVDSNFGMGLVQGQWYYYTLFAKMPNSIPNWNQVDTDFAVCTRDYGSGDNLWNKIPGFYRSEDANTLQRQLVYTSGGQLRRFVDLLGYEIDVMRTELDSLLDVNSPKDMASPLLALQGYDLSLPDEGAIGDARFRALVDSALGLRETKGTEFGIIEYIRAMSDYDARVLPRRNLVESTLQSRGTDITNTSDPTVFVPSFPNIPKWIMTSSHGAQPDWRWVSTATAGITPPTGSGYDGKAVWMFQLDQGLSVVNNVSIIHLDNITGYDRATGNPNNAAAVLAGGAKPLPVPVTGVTYTYSVLMLALNPANIGTINIRFVWLDAQGIFISSDAHAVTTPATFPGPPTARSAVSSVAPANAVYCHPEVWIPATAAATWKLWTGAQQFDPTSVATGTYIDPHTAEIQLIAQRVNLVPNPSAEVDNSLWTGTNMTSLLSVVNAAATAGAKVFQITCSASANPTMTTGPAFMPINAAYIQSFRFDASVPNASIGANAIIQWYDGAATPNLIRTDTLNFPAPLPVNMMRTYVFGNVVPPSTAVNAKVAIQFTGTANGNVILVDSVLFGPGPPMFYFDGDTQDGLDTPPTVTPTVFSDFQWSGLQGRSTSYYYNNFYIAQKRLAADISNWVPYGTQTNWNTKVAP